MKRAKYGTLGRFGLINLFCLGGSFNRFSSVRDGISIYSLTKHSKAKQLVSYLLNHPSSKHKRAKCFIQFGYLSSKLDLLMATAALFKFKLEEYQCCSCCYVLLRVNAALAVAVSIVTRVNADLAVILKKTLRSFRISSVRICLGEKTKWK